MTRRLHLFAWLPFALAGTSPVCADQQRDAFVEANVIAILYHELAHAVIDLMLIPIFGQEEDAADVMAVLMIDRIFDEATARAIAYDSAFGYLEDPSDEYDVAWWDTHGPDQQRYYNHVCLFYGADPEAREDLAEELGLPGERADSCPEEFELAADSWGEIFDDMARTDAGGLVFVDNSAEAHPETAELLAGETAALNEDFGLPEIVEIRFESCGEPNAFYDPEDASITFCTEFVSSLENLYERLDAQ